VVDPGDAQPVLQALSTHGLQLLGILVTHHHADHTGGVNLLRERTGATVFGPAHEPMPEPIRRLGDGDTVDLLGLTFLVLDVPGHTRGHIAYFCAAAPLEAAAVPLLFCGDTLFSAGCGRLFEGTPSQMLASLDRLSALPDSSLVCCTHEYTLSNLKFALAVDPDNAALTAYADRCRSLRAEGKPTLPSTLALELQINPFLRTRTPAVDTATRQFDPAMVEKFGVFACLRQWKNIFT
jgi:hydroxyacylglutathione hydrolase